MKVLLKRKELAEHLARGNRSLNGWAAKLEMSSGHLSQLLSGYRRYPAPKTRRKLLEGLQVPFEDLFEVQVTSDKRTE